MPRGRPKGGNFSEKVNELIKQNVMNKDDLRSVVPKPNVPKEPSNQLFAPKGTTTEIKKIDSDHIYYNVLIPNNDQSEVRAKFMEVRGEPLINNPPEWEMSIVRFKLPTQLVPIFYVDLKTYPDITKYSICLTNGAVESYKDVVYVPENNNTYPVAPYAGMPKGYWAVYTYQHFIDLINTTLLNAFNDPTFNASLPITGTAWAAPYMVYNAQTQLFSLIAQQQYKTSGIKIYMNNLLFNFFDPLEAYFNGYNQPNGKEFEILVKNNYNNSITIPTGSLGAGTAGYEMKQEYSSLPRWNSFSKFVFMTGSIPIRPENINATTTQQLQQSSITNFQPILTDFIPVLSNTVRNNVIYYPTAEYRMTDLVGNTPLNIVDLQIFWEDKNQILYPLDIPINESVNVKFLFRKKKL